MGEVIEENDLAQHIRYHHRITSARWSSADHLWTVEATETESGTVHRFTANFLWMCQGYYRHSEGYTPTWPGMEDYEGELIHPQSWPEDLDYSGKHVVVIGSGATAATLVPAIADSCEHVTVLQRSPTYYIPGRNRSDIADTLRELDIDEEWIHEIVRRQILLDQDKFTRRARDEPEEVRRELLGAVRRFLGPDYDIETHFTPSYRPWRQRIAFVPDGDLLRAIRSGRASVVTDQIERFTPSGIRLRSGAELRADIVVTATGFNMNVLGDIDFEIDREPLDFSESVTYRGMMFTAIPISSGSSVTFVPAGRSVPTSSRTSSATARPHGEARRDTGRRQAPGRRQRHGTPPWIDPENFNPGYLMRAMDLLPKRGDKREWQHTQDYWSEKDEIPAIDLDGPEFVYS